MLRCEWVRTLSSVRFDLVKEGKRRERKGYKTKHGIEREIERERGRRIEEAPEAEAFGFGALIRMERL